MNQPYGAMEAGVRMHGVSKTVKAWFKVVITTIGGMLARRML